MNESLPRACTLALAVALALAAAGCAVSPEPLNGGQIAERVRSDRERMYRGQEPIASALTLEEVTARAIKYNLDYRLRMMEGALQQGVLDVSRFDMLPRLTASAGYLWRNKELYSQTQTLGQPFDENGAFTTSTQKSHRIAGAELSWNLLDFGVSYYRAKAQADQVLLAEERKRKVVQNIVQDVRNAYWRALGAQRLAARIDDLLKRADGALEKARAIEQQGLMPVPQALAYQRALLDAITQLQSRRQDLELSRAELGSLMNLAPNVGFTLSDLAEDPLPAPPASVAELESVAMNSRPELREEDYRKRISAAEARRAIASTLPNISFDAGFQYDSNKYLLNNAWVDSGVRISMNLFRLAAIPAIRRQAQAQDAVDEARRMAQSMAVLTQVRVAAVRYGLARSEYETFYQSARVDERLADFARVSASSRVESELEVIRTEARALLSEYQRHIAYANAQSAAGRLYNSIGLDIDATDESVPVRALATQIRSSLRKWEAFTFRTVPAAGGQLAPLALRFVGVDEPSQRLLIKRSLARVFRGYDVDLINGASEGERIWTLQARREQVVTADGQATQWVLELMRPNGSVAARSMQSASAPSADPDLDLATDMTSLADAAVIGVRNVLASEREYVLALR
ncbi:MAG: TolC family protein [Lautropia sp.]